MKPTLRLLLGSVLISVLATTLVSCSDGDSFVSGKASPEPAAQPAPEVSVSSRVRSGRVRSDRERFAYLGDLHVHTTYSFDAFAFGPCNPGDACDRDEQEQGATHDGGHSVRIP